MKPNIFFIDFSWIRKQISGAGGWKEILTSL